MRFTLYYPVKPKDISQLWGVEHPEYALRGLPYSRHNGIDFRLNQGQLISCPFDCTVTVTQTDAAQGGNSGIFVCLLSGSEYEFDDGKSAFVELSFMHCSKLLVEKGQILKAGDPIALGGSTGYSDSPHTHMQPLRVRVEGDGSYYKMDDNADAFYTFDPMPYFNGKFVADISMHTGVQPFVRYLSLGSTGDDVILLQKILNSDPNTMIASQGPGSPGNETNYFGALTKKAVQKFQTKYGIADSNNPAYGAVGPRTRAKLQECANALHL